MLTSSSTSSRSLLLLSLLPLLLLPLIQSLLLLPCLPPLPLVLLPLLSLLLLLCLLKKEKEKEAMCFFLYSAYDDRVLRKKKKEEGSKVISCCISSYLSNYNSFVKECTLCILCKGETPNEINYSSNQSLHLFPPKSFFYSFFFFICLFVRLREEIETRVIWPVYSFSECIFSLLESIYG